MSSSIAAGTLAVALPGAGSDAAFMRELFGPAAEASGLRLLAVDPDPGGVRSSYVEALDEAARSAKRVLVCGFSIGAHIGAQWASAHQDQCVGVLACLPAWLGDPREALAAQNAKQTAALLRAEGLETALANMRAASPAWVAERLSRSWSAQWPKLPDAFDEISRTALPTAQALASLRLPVVLATVNGDPFHPVVAARAWHEKLPCSTLVTLGFDEVGENPARLGRAAFAALEKLSSEIATL